MSARQPTVRMTEDGDVLISTLEDDGQVEEISISSVHLAPLAAQLHQVAVGWQAEDPGPCPVDLAADAPGDDQVLDVDNSPRWRAPIPRLPR